jgi:hypothetical protein
LKLHSSLDALLADPPDILCLATAQGLHADHIEVTQLDRDCAATVSNGCIKFTRLTQNLQVDTAV